MVTVTESDARHDGIGDVDYLIKASMAQRKTPENAGDDDDGDDGDGDYDDAEDDRTDDVAGLETECFLYGP